MGQPIEGSNPSLSATPARDIKRRRPVPWAAAFTERVDYWCAAVKPTQATSYCDTACQLSGFEWESSEPA